MSTDTFPYDVFLSHSSKDKAVARPLAERLRQDRLKVWFDEWVLKPGDSIPAKIEEGLEHSRVLILCMSANAFGSDWAQLEAGTFRFRDPLNRERRFIPLRLDDAPIKGSLAHFLYVDWHLTVREQEYAKLVEACRAPAKPVAKEGKVTRRQALGIGTFSTYAFSSDGKRVITGLRFGEMMLPMWDVATGERLDAFEGHTNSVWSVVLSADGRCALSASSDRTVRLWDVKSGCCLRVLEGAKTDVFQVAWSTDGRLALSAEDNKTTRIWEVETGHCLRTLMGHTTDVRSVAWSEDNRLAASGAFDGSVRVWEVESGLCVRALEGHAGPVWGIAFGANGSRVLSGSGDGTLRLWAVESGRCMRVLEGHTDQVWSVAWNTSRNLALSGSGDRTVRLWDVNTGLCLCVLADHRAQVMTVAWSADGQRAFSGDAIGEIRVWDLSEFVTVARTPKATAPAEPLAPDQVQYTNAKVLLVGETSAGKTGLSKRLALGRWERSDSTVGAWATQWKLPVARSRGIEREIWLWDFGGQADQRLIHQLYMDETALAVLVFDGQKEDLFETLGQWDRDLTRASRNAFAKLLVAGRVDAGGLRLSRKEIEKFVEERQFRGFLETSAKKNLGCEELKQAILDAINWDELPCRTTEVLFRRLKEEIIRLKDENRVLVRFNELREILQLRLASPPNIPVRPDEETRVAYPSAERFSDEQLKAVLTLLAGPCVVWELAFGSWVLLQPERINAYAQAVIRTLQGDEHQRGCIMEERILEGNLGYESSMPRLASDEERFVLLAMHQTLVERGLCLRQPTDKGNLLVFPSYYRRERPDQVEFPAVLSSYRFTGFLDEIYATLVVRLHHTTPFDQEQLWRYAADFKTNTGKLLGIKLTRLAPGVGELEVYFDPAVAMEEKIIFCKYVHEHLLQQAQNVERLRHYVCKCGTPVGNREVARKRLNDWLDGTVADATTGTRRVIRGKADPPSIICVDCEQRVPLWDEMEQCFARPEIQQRVRDMQEESTIVLDNESKERALVGEVISTVALAAQISREKNVSDHGIDMEIEFKDDANEATGRMLYLQLKSGNSYLRERKGDGAEIFTIKDERHARYWMAQAFPVMLVIRNAEGEVRWMEVRDWLKRVSDNGKKPVNQVIFMGERFDVMSVRRWRERLLSNPVS